MNTKLLILDLDNTVRRSKSGVKFINTPLDQEIIPEAAKAIASYVSKGWLVVGATNQDRVVAGKKTLEDAIAEQTLTLKLLQPYVHTIYFCPDFNGEACYRVVQIDGMYRCSAINDLNDEDLLPLKGLYRKPNPGMLKLAQMECVFKPKEILFVGDRDEGEQAATAANIPFLWAADWWNSL